ncbi:DUF2231 domain-containing protein [Novosphingobium tardum]|uniref:DUF2231 domain-containing protein n=1 Tax=Novosphingobium tardum TaxID=1538021 RepID=A0ABV8RSE4_9SPHN
MEANPIRPRASIGGVPIHAMLVPFPIACFTGALLTDITYAKSADIQWTNFSQWLLAFGLLMAVIAGLFGLVDFLSGPRPRPSIGWWHLGGNALLMAVALVNNFVHARDGWTSVVPTGLILSIVTVALMVVTGFLGHRMAYRHVGARP